MIPRYESSEISSVWSYENKIIYWAQFEHLAASAAAKQGIIPEDAAREIYEAFNKVAKEPEIIVPQILEKERATKHDVAAFVDVFSTLVSAENARWVHYGLTSSDVVDSAMAVQITESVRYIYRDAIKLVDLLSERAKEFIDTPMMGRTHGMWAEPTTFGMVLTRWSFDIGRRLLPLRDIASGGAPFKLSGAVGTYSHLEPDVEQEVARTTGGWALGLGSQIIGRDFHAEVLNSIALFGAALENIATTIRGMQRSEVGEIFESFSKGQKGSSSMPHKKNPVLSENITGLARVLRGYAQTAMENVALWHERDISHSSAERIIFPDAFGLLHFMIKRMHGIIEGLYVNYDRMSANIHSTEGRWACQGIMLMLIRNGQSRKEAYKFVQSVAMLPNSHFEDRMRVELEDLGFSHKEIGECFSLEHHLRNIKGVCNVKQDVIDSDT